MCTTIGMGLRISNKKEVIAVGGIVLAIGIVLATGIVLAIGTGLGLRLGLGKGSYTKCMIQMMHKAVVKERTERKEIYCLGLTLRLGLGLG